MPRIKRWFPVSHDINADPELWELTDTFGDRSLRVWLEILAIADRNGGELPGPWKAYPSILAGRCKSTARHLRAVCEWVTRWLEVDSQGVARVRNYAKYHRPKEPNKLPTDQTEPDLPILESKDSCQRPDEETISVKDFVESWNETFTGKLSQVEWPLSATRHRKVAARLKEHRSVEFWQQVFANILKSRFLLGTNNGKSNWRCNFDFVVNNDTNCVKIYEGQYA